MTAPFPVSDKAVAEARNWSHHVGADLSDGVLIGVLQAGGPYLHAGPETAMTPTTMTPATMTVEWNHPSLGRIGERVCQRHEREVIAALTYLGIGCGGVQYFGPQLTCGRCLADVGGIPARDYVAMARTRS